MFFNSFPFLEFFLVVLIVHWSVPATLATPVARVRTLVLLVASYYFYMCWNHWLAALVAGTSLLDYGIALLMERSTCTRRRRELLVASIAMNMGLLFYFKYMNFFLQSLHQALQRAGMRGEMPLLDVVLPIGISFYTFEAISYTVDVYHRRVRAERNPLHFLLFITFFPRMVAGPIIRAKNFLPQLRRAGRFSPLRFRAGLEQALMGLFKKMVVADNMALLSDPVFADPGHYGTMAAWIGVIAYSLQIYCDFSGYSDIAIGTANMLGFRLPRNFNMPYLSRNISEFWRRWHISLSTWLRDYVFISMGGSRGTPARTVFTLMATMVLCGLWHGAQWTFVAFGVIHGVYMVLHRLFQGFAKARPAFDRFLGTAAGSALRTALTCLAVAAGWVVFRAPDFATAGGVFHRLADMHKGATVRDPIGPAWLLYTLAVVAAAHIAARSGWWRRVNERLSPAQWGFVYSTLVLLICFLAPTTQKGFIYFQF